MFYNVLSSVLACVGMIVGLLLGTIHSFSAWMFTATAGIFLYVALVDMLPELTSAHSHPSSVDEKQDKKVRREQYFIHSCKNIEHISGAALGVPAAAGDRHGLRGSHHARHRPL